MPDSDIFTGPSIEDVADQSEAAREKVRVRKHNYIQTFMNPAGQAVLSDLAIFCRAAESCFHPDPRIHAVAEGRREAFIRIQDHLQLTPDQLYALYRGSVFEARADQMNTEG